MGKTSPGDLGPSIQRVIEFYEAGAFAGIDGDGPEPSVTVLHAGAGADPIDRGSG